MVGVTQFMRQSEQILVRVSVGHENAALAKRPQAGAVTATCLAGTILGFDPPLINCHPVELSHVRGELAHVTDDKLGGFVIAVQSVNLAARGHLVIPAVFVNAEQLFLGLYVWSEFFYVTCND